MGARARASDMFRAGAIFFSSRLPFSIKRSSPAVLWGFRHVERVVHQSPARNGHGRGSRRYGDSRYSRCARTSSRSTTLRESSRRLRTPSSTPPRFMAPSTAPGLSGRSRTFSPGGSAAIRANGADKAEDLSSVEEDGGAGGVDGGEEKSWRACRNACDGREMLELVEKTLNEIAFAVEREVGRGVLRLDLDGMTGTIARSSRAAMKASASNACWRSRRRDRRLRLAVERKSDRDPGPG